MANVGHTPLFVGARDLKDIAPVNKLHGYSLPKGKIRIINVSGLGAIQAVHGKREILLRESFRQILIPFIEVPHNSKNCAKHT